MASNCSRSSRAGSKTAESSVTGCRFEFGSRPQCLFSGDSLTSQNPFAAAADHDGQIERVVTMEKMTCATLFVLALLYTDSASAFSSMAGPGFYNGTQNPVQVKAKFESGGPWITIPLDPGML